MFTGGITEWVFNGPRENLFDRATKTVSYFGTGNEPCPYTTVDDLAAYTVAAVTAPGAENGGLVYVESFRMSPLDIASALEEVSGVKITTKRLGSLEDAQSLLQEQRRTTPPTEFSKYIGLAYVVHIAKGTWDAESVDCARFKDVKQTSLKEWLEKNPQI